MDGNNENISVEVNNNGKCEKNLGENEDDPLTILKSVKAAHSKENTKGPKRRGNKKATSIEGVKFTKDELVDEKRSETN